ncbi:hypothetical protein XPN_1705, partial [Xanthomonas arboricola pv. pruni MAFF 301427]
MPYQRHGDPASTFYQGLAAFGYAFSPNLELYGHLSMSRREVTSNGYYRAADNTARNVQAIYPNGFLPQIYNPTNDRSAVLGLKGSTESEWNWDVSATYGKNDMNFNILNSINTNLYYTTGSSPTNFNSGGFETEQGTINLDVNKSFDWAWRIRSMWPSVPSIVRTATRSPPARRSRTSSTPIPSIPTTARRIRAAR